MAFYLTDQAINLCPPQPPALQGLILFFLLFNWSLALVVSLERRIHFFNWQQSPALSILLHTVT